MFETREKYIKYIKKSAVLDFNIVYDILSIPNCISKKGINMIIFEKKVIKIKTDLERDKVSNDYVINCISNIRKKYIKNPEKDNIFLLKDSKIFFQ